MPQKKFEITAAGATESFVVTNESACRYFADFTGGAGTIQLEMMIAGDWLPAADAITASMSVVEVADGPSSEHTPFRWNCTSYTSGTILGYLG